MLPVSFWIFSLALPGIYGFIIPNDIPTALSLVWSSIPPLKIGVDNRFGVGFRLGPHADFQTLVEVGPQLNTRPLGGDDSSSKRDVPNSPFSGKPSVSAEQPIQQQLIADKPAEEDEKKEKKPAKKSPFVEKIVFKKVPGIDQ